MLLFQNGSSRQILQNGYVRTNFRVSVDCPENCRCTPDEDDDEEMILFFNYEEIFLLADMLFDAKVCFR